MRVPRVRFTVRRMMVAVGVVAILTTLGLGITPEVRRRWNACQTATYRQAQLARMHATDAARAALEQFAEIQDDLAKV